MRKSKITFENIVETLKEDIGQNIFELTYKLQCSNTLIYSRLIEKGFKGLSQLKDAIEEGKL